VMERVLRWAAGGTNSGESKAASTGDVAWHVNRRVH
jgi:hypothetical protein